MKVTVDLSVRHAMRIEVNWEDANDGEFRYAIREVKGIDGARFVGRDNGGPYWHVPLSIGVCRELRESFGDMLVVTRRLADWAKADIAQRSKLATISASTDASLSRLPGELPWLSDTLHDYQRVAAAFIGSTRSALIADQPGLGKTLETIAGIAEAGKIEGCHLVLAPKTALETVWEAEILKWGTGSVCIFAGTRKQKREALEMFLADKSETKWLVTNPESLRLTKVKTGRLDPKTMKDEYVLVPNWPKLYAIKWNSITVDECHKGAIRNPATVTAQSLSTLEIAEGGLKLALSGTPMKNRPMDLWGTLHWLYPQKFSSKWEWAGRYCEITDNGFGKKIGGIRKDREAELVESLSGIMLRRTKGEVLKELPPKLHIPVWCRMTTTQRKQYDEMVENAEVRLSSGSVIGATNVLTELLRLKQFSICRFDATEDRDKPVGPTFDSGKLEALAELLEQRAIFENGVAPEEREKVVVFSQFSQIVDVAAKFLAAKGANVTQITGGFSGRVTEAGRQEMTRAEIQREFQTDRGTNALCMTTTAGGVAITLDRADSVYFLDETWSPADMEQAEDRVHRASRTDHQVMVYVLRSYDSVDEYIREIVADKSNTAAAVLDDPRMALRGTPVAAQG